MSVGAFFEEHLALSITIVRGLSQGELLRRLHLNAIGDEFVGLEALPDLPGNPILLDAQEAAIVLLERFASLGLEPGVLATLSEPRGLALCIASSESIKLFALAREGVDHLFFDLTLPQTSYGPFWTVYSQDLASVGFEPGMLPKSPLDAAWSLAGALIGVDLDREFLRRPHRLVTR